MVWGHAVSLSDPRAVIFRSFVKNSPKRAMKKNSKLYATVERLAEIIAKERKIGVSPNVDFYSFAYSMLGLPVELYTPILPLHESPAGVHTVLRKWHTVARSCVLHTRMLANEKLMFLWRNVKIENSCHWEHTGYYRFRSVSMTTVFYVTHIINVKTSLSLSPMNSETR